MPSKKGSKWTKNHEDSILRWEYYKKQDPTRTQEECELLATKRRKARNKGSIEYYELHFPGLSHDDHINMLNEYKRKYNENQPTHIEYYEKHYPNLTHDEQIKLHNIYLRTTNIECIEYYEKRYPELSHEEHEKMLNDAKSRKKHHPLFGEKNPGHNSNTTDLERKQRSPKCMEFYEKRYPELSHEEHLMMMNEHKKIVKQKLQDPKNQILCVDYWLNKGYSIEETERQLKKEYQKRTFTLEKCIKKYGEDEGRRKFEDRQVKWQKAIHESFGKSKIAQSQLAQGIINEIKKKYVGEIEFQLDKYSFDFKYKNILIEINGDYWHCNPKIYKPFDINKVTGKKACDIWKKDKEKINKAKSLGYIVYTIWEQDYRNNPGLTIRHCMNFIHDNISN